MREATDTRIETTSDARGRFAFDERIKTPGAYRVEIKSEQKQRAVHVELKIGGEARGQGATPVLELAEGEGSCDLQVALGRIQLDGVVVDASTKTPIANAAISVGHQKPTLATTHST